MIVVKTKMRKVPIACTACSYYTPSTYSEVSKAACHAIGGYSTYGKHIYVQSSKERPEWCPLVEIER